jgi:hypothetical protein
MYNYVQLVAETANRTGQSRGGPSGPSENRSGGEAGAEARSVPLTARDFTDSTLELAGRRSRLAHVPPRSERQRTKFGADCILRAKTTAQRARRYKVRRRPGTIAKYGQADAG